MGRVGRLRFNNANNTLTVTDQIAGRDGVDTLNNVGYLKFADKTQSFGDYSNTQSQPPLFSTPTGYIQATAYTGPVTGLKWQLINQDPNAVITGSSGNEFIKLSNTTSAGKAVNGNGGTDVIDGGVGSTFITGGTNHANTTFFLDGRAPGTTWSTITDFALGDNATIWGFVKGVSKLNTSFNDANTGGVAGYTGLTLHFDNLLPDGQSSGTNANINSITLTGRTLSDIGASSIADLNNQIANSSYNSATGQYTVNNHLIIGQTADATGTHSYLFIH